ncbi:MAG: hypothetical protein ACO1Q7_00570 [Gemmatimonas sp.]
MSTPSRVAAQSHATTPAASATTAVVCSALWIAVAVNLLGVSVFLPAALGRESSLLPIPGPPFYAAQVTLVIAIFCGVYLWLAVQRTINKPLLVVGAVGKLGFFLSTVAYWYRGDLPASVITQSSPDLLLALVFLWWAATH